jgi:hypothetical protein
MKISVDIASLKTGMYGEVISNSSLKSMIPEEDPRAIPLPIVMDCKELGDTLANAALPLSNTLSGKPDSALDDIPSFGINGHINGHPDRIVDDLISYLNHRTLQFNSRENFSRFEPWRTTVANVVSEKENRCQSLSLFFVISGIHLNGLM